MDPNVIVAFIAAVSAVAAAYISTNRRADNVASTARDVAREVTVERKAEIDDLKEEIAKLRTAERGCQQLLTLVMARLTALESSRTHNGG